LYYIVALLPKVTITAKAIIAERHYVLGISQNGLEPDSSSSSDELQENEEVRNLDRTSFARLSSNIV